MTRRDDYPYSVSTVSARNAWDHIPPSGVHKKKMRRLHFQSKKDELELDVRIRHYHSATKTNNVNHGNTAYSLKYPQNTFELKLLEETSFEQKLKHKKERVSKTSVLQWPTFVMWYQPCYSG